MKAGVVVSLGVAVIVLGCQTPAYVPAPQAAPPAIESPPDGESLLYLFRPTLDKVARSEEPILSVDDQVVAKIAYATYTTVSLQAGRHHLKLTPEVKDSAGWNTEVGFEVVAGETYFVAIWNQDQSGSGRIYVPIPLPGVLYIVSIRRGAEARVRFEPMDRDLGVSALAGLRLIPAQVNHLPAKQ